MSVCGYKQYIRMGMHIPMGVQVIPIPVDLVSHFLPFQFPFLYFIHIPVGFPFPLGIPFPCTSLH